VFSQHLSLAGTHAAALAAELVQEPFQGPNPCEASGPSLLKQLHVQLLTLVSRWQAAALNHMSGPVVQTYTHGGMHAVDTLIEGSIRTSQMVEQSSIMRDSSLLLVICSCNIFMQYTHAIYSCSVDRTLQSLVCQTQRHFLSGATASCTMSSPSEFAGNAQVDVLLTLCML